MRLQNLHTHSTYCDGKNTLRELAEEAVKKGFCTLGFSSHSFTEFDQSYCMKNESEYIRECAGLKEEYKDRLDILRGLELEYYSDAPKYPYDYLIGSVHYICCGEEFVPVDESPQILEEAAKKVFWRGHHGYLREILRYCRGRREKNRLRHYRALRSYNQVLRGKTGSDRP